MNKLWIIARKEWAEVFKNRFVLFTVAFLPLIFTALPLIMLATMGESGDLEGLTSDDMPARFAELCEGMKGPECSQYFIVSQFMLTALLGRRRGALWSRYWRRRYQPYRCWEEKLWPPFCRRSWSHGSVLASLSLGLLS